MAKTEFKIGQTFQCGHVKLKVEKSKSCDKCFFNSTMYECESNLYFMDSCIAKEREDKNDVIFVKVEE